MRFAAKWNAFCRKMESEWPKIKGVLAQNKRRFGPKWKAIWPKMEGDLAQNANYLSIKGGAFVCVYLSETIANLLLSEKNENSKTRTI